MKCTLIACLLALCGCVVPPLKFTYSQVEAIKPGITTRADVLRTFGEPKRFSGGEPKTFTYEDRSGYRVQTVNIYFTNDVVSMVFSSISDLDPLVW